MPNCGISRSRNVRIKLSLQVAELSSLEARNDRGNPPRCHRSLQLVAPVSWRWNGPKSTNPTRPARDSETPLMRLGEALPSKRNRVLCSGRSNSTRRVSKRAGWRWISSMTTSPSNSDRACSGASNLRRSAALSKSKKVHRFSVPAIRRASVVLPHWRGPARATAECAANALRIESKACIRSITDGVLSLKI